MPAKFTIRGDNMKKAFYPAIVKKGNKDYIVKFYDIPHGITQGSNLDEVAEKAREVLELCIEGFLEDKEEIPTPTFPENIKLGNEEFIILVDVNITLIKNELENKAVKKTLTIPYWLNEIAEENKVNFSQLLQVAIKEHLNISRTPEH